PERSRHAPPVPATCGRRLCFRAPEVHPVYLNRTRDVLDLLRTEVLEREAQLIQYLVADNSARADSPRFCHRLQPRGDIDAVAMNVVAINDDVADVDANTKVKTLMGRSSCITLGHATLHVDRTAHRIDNAREFQQQTITGCLDYPAAILVDLGVDQLPTMGL